MANYITKEFLLSFFLGLFTCLNVYTQTSADSVKGKILFEEGMTAFRESRAWGVLIEKFTEGIPLLEQSGPWPTYIKMCRGLNKYYSDIQYDFDSILKYSDKFYEAQTSHVQIKDENYYSAVSDVGALRIRQGAYNQALTIFQDVYAFYLTDTSTSTNSFANVYHSLGLCYREKGDYDEAMRFYDRSIDLLKATPSFSLALEYNQKAKLLEELERTDEAVHLYEKAIPMLDSKLKREHQLLINFYLSLADIFNEQEQDAKVFHYLDKAGELQNINENSDIESTYDILSRLYIRKKDFKQALYYQSLYENRTKELLRGRKRHPSLVKSKQLKAQILAEMGELEEALQLSQENLGLLSENWRYAQTWENPDAASIIQPIYAIPVLKDKAKYLFEIAQKSGRISDFEASLSTYQLTSALISGLRNDFQSKESVLLLSEITNPTLEEALNVTYHLYEKTKDVKYIQDALSFMEQNKAALLQAYLQDIYAKGNMGIPEELQVEEASLSDKITDLQRIIFLFGEKDSLTEKEIQRLNRQKEELFQLENRKRDFMARLEQDFPAYYDKKYENTLASLKSLQNDLQKDDLLIEYFWGQEEVFVLAVSSQKVLFQKVIINQENIRDIHAFRNMLKDREQVLKEGLSVNYYHEFCQYSFAIYENFLQEVLTEFPQKNRLVLVPDGLLSYVPFEVLLEQKESSSVVNYAGLSYLLKNHPINYAYSATLFEKAALNPKKEKKGTALSVAPAYQNTEDWNPDLLENLRDASTRSGFAPLKYNKSEAESIESIWKGKALHTQSATEQNFKELAGEYKIIHLAMHAYANDENPMFSALVFKDSESMDTQEEEEDGILYAQEIYNMNLGADLVVLSACNTGAGKLRQGEGILSLARAFAFAGCPSTAMSLWQADDETISTIMKSFHRYLKEGKSKSFAMRQAKLDFLANSDRTHPYFWAAYMTIGDDSPIAGEFDLKWIFLLTIMALLIGGWLMRKNKLSASNM